VHSAFFLEKNLETGVVTTIPVSLTATFLATTPVSIEWGSVAM